MSDQNTPPSQQFHDPQDITQTKIRAVWINVDGHISREEKMRESLDDISIENYRCSAITPETLDISIVKDGGVVTYIPDIVKACMCSHLKAQEMALKILQDYNEEWILISEDDMQYMCSQRYLLRVIENAPHKAEVLQLYTCNPDVYSSLFESRYSGDLWQRWTTKHRGTGAYLIRKRGLEINIGSYKNKYDNKINFDCIPRGLIAPEAIAYSQLIAYTITCPKIISDKTIESEVYSSHSTDQIYCNYIIRTLCDLGMFRKAVFIMGSNSVTCKFAEIQNTLNSEVYIKILLESDPKPRWEESNTVDIDKFIDYKIDCLLLEHKPIVGDIHSCYINYVDDIVSRFGSSVMFVCLKDTRKACKESFLSSSYGTNYWDNSSMYARDPEMDYSYPKYTKMFKSNAIQKYWGSYYEIAQTLQDRYPDQFRIFSSTTLNKTSIYVFLKIIKRTDG